MNLLELGALAQIAGAIAIIISLILVLIELRKDSSTTSFVKYSCSID